MITYMQTIKMISISGGSPVMAFPLMFVVFVSMVKDAFEDYKRHQSDADENDKLCEVYDPY
jgi:phospholipid-transporting ATPase